VSLLPSLTAIAVELGAADRLVACTEFCEPGRDLPRVDWRGPAAAEGILRLRPDLVLKQDPRRPDDPLRDVLAASGIPVISVPTETIDDVRGAIARVGAVLGKEREAAAYRESFDAALVRARRGAAGRERPAVLFVLSRDAGKAANVAAAGPGTFLDELIRYAGGRNVLDDVDVPYPAVRLEQIVRLKPDVIIDNLPAEDDPRAVWDDLAGAGVPAIRDGRVRVVQDNRLLIPGPHIPRSVERMVELIHGR